MFMHSKILINTLMLVLGLIAVQAVQAQQLMPYRPSDELHVHYATGAYYDVEAYDEAYKKDGWKIKNDWELLFSHKDTNGYFGVAYLNRSQKHIIIAHRGTEIGFPGFGVGLKDLVSDVALITSRLDEQEVSSWYDFTKKIIDRYGPSHTYSFTGHSLGGWLAQVCLWKYQDEYVKREASLYQDGFAVTLDEPGAKDLLEALQPRVESGYRIDVENLDITTYLSKPNFINTIMGHVGSVYALSLEPKLNWLQRNTILYTKKMHSCGDLLKEFSDETGLPRETKKTMRVIDWPKVEWGEPLASTSPKKTALGYLAHMIKAYFKGDIQRGEYNGFFKYDAQKVNNPQELPPASQFMLQHGIHYRLEPYDSQALPLRNMPRPMRKFLEELHKNQDRANTVNELVASPIDIELATLLNAYTINERNELSIDRAKARGVDARGFIAKVRQFLSANPKLYQNNLSVLQMADLSQRLQSVQVGTLPGLMSSLQKQMQGTQNLLYKLGQKQSMARLYKFVKPSWEEIEQLKDEQRTLNEQLMILQASKLSLETFGLDSKYTKQLVQLLQMLEEQQQQLKFAQKATGVFLMYMEGDLVPADKQLEDLIVILKGQNNLPPGLEQKVLLNRAYNLKAKIAALQIGKKDASAQYYRLATEVLPNDSITWNNYGGLLTDRGLAEKNPQLHLAAYHCYQEVATRLTQIKPEQQPTVYSGMAYGLILLAQNVEQGQIDVTKNKLPSVKELRNQARNLLIEAVKVKASYLNTRLHLAILSYDEGDYKNGLQEIDNTLSLQPVHPMALMYKGLILDKLNETKQALDYLERAKERFAEMQKQNGEHVSWIKEIESKIAQITRRGKLPSSKL